MDNTINFQSIKSIQSMLEDKFPEIVETYERNAKKYLEEIYSGIEAGNAEQIRSAAHSLKSSSRMMGLEGAGDLSENIEVAAKEGDCRQSERFEMLSQYINEGMAILISKKNKA